MPTQPHSAQSVLHTLASEIRALARQTDHVQTLVGDLLTNGAQASDANITELQSIDHITQSLDGLADFLGSLSADTPAEWEHAHLNAANCVKLEDLAARLCGSVGETSEANEDDGELDLF